MTPRAALPGPLPVRPGPEDELVAGRPFAFGGDVAERFETDVVNRQVPGYDTMRARVAELGGHFVRPGRTVLDLGTSRARTIRDLVMTCGPELSRRVRWVGLDREPDMLDHARRDVDALLGTLGLADGRVGGPVELQRWDLRDGLPELGSGETGRGEQTRWSDRGSCSLVTAVLTVQFVPVEHRDQLLGAIHDRLEPGGAFIWVDKVLASSSRTEPLLRRAHEDHKRRQGMSEHAIRAKREALEGVLVAQRPEQNRAALHAAGFDLHDVETFWRDLCFEGLLAVKR